MKNKILVEKIIKYISKIINYTKNTKYEDFINNSMLVEACVFNLSQIGELSNKISKEFEVENPSIPWRTMYGLRNRIIHDYEGVNLSLIWDIVSEDLPELKTQLENLEQNCHSKPVEES